LYFGSFFFFQQTPSVRSSAIRALIPLVQNENNLASLNNFCHRFLDRMMEMTRDNDPDNASIAINLVTEYLKYDSPQT
jgi:hypothetical protein